MNENEIFKFLRDNLSLREEAFSFYNNSTTFTLFLKNPETGQEESLGTVTTDGCNCDCQH